jgi:hypothetical protein
LKPKKLQSDLKHFLDWKKMIKLCKPNFVVVATPPRLQSRILIYLIKNNISFFAQKPLSYNYINSKSILQKIKKKKIISDLDLNFLRLDAIIKFRNLINKKKLINSNVSVKWYLNSTTLKNKGSWKNDEKKGGGLLYNFGFHLFAILLDLFGDLKLLNAIKKKNFYSLDYQDKKKNFINIILSNNKKNKNLFEISAEDKKKNVYSIKNISRNYHDNFRITQNKKVIFVQKNNKNPKISRRIASGLIIENFLKNLNNKKKFMSKNIELSIKVHEHINSINKS